MSKGRRRSISINVSQIDKTRLIKHANGNVYMNLDTYDYDEPDKFDQDFNVSMSRTQAEKDRIATGEKIDRVFIGNGRIWPDTGGQPLTEADKDDLPF